MNKGNLPLAPSSAASSATSHSAGIRQGPVIFSHQASGTERSEVKGTQYLPLGTPWSRRSRGDESS